MNARLAVCCRRTLVKTELRPASLSCLSVFWKTSCSRQNSRTSFSRSGPLYRPCTSLNDKRLLHTERYQLPFDRKVTGTFQKKRPGRINVHPGREFFAVPPGFAAFFAASWIDLHRSGAHFVSQSASLNQSIFSGGDSGVIFSKSGPELTLSSGRFSLVGCLLVPISVLPGKVALKSSKDKENCNPEAVLAEQGSLYL